MFLDDPPFCLKKRLFDESCLLGVRSEGSAHSVPAKIGPTAPTASLLAQMDATYDNDSEDFRSVIDDLTIQNKKLRKKLKKYERLHCSHLQEEKLFEVRIHGLPAHRKRELEDTLRSFASSIEEESPRKCESLDAQLSNAVSSSMPLHKPASSSTSYFKPLDSAYSSMTGNGVNQFHPHHHKASQAISSYMHGIPESLMPKHPQAMSDKTKSKIVVRRLEQIFTGKGAASRLQKHSHQQQEVSRSAAEADRSKLEACGQRVWHEGTREAPILPNGADLKVETIEEANAAGQKSGGSLEGMGSHSRESRAVSPEQRPTRPLDLDPHRAQIPSDNIGYIRHLGLVSPTDSGNIMSDGDDGWVYLNLLISMAQLHTLSVTPEFVRKAVAEVSDKFELSADGTKVKWLGGTEGTRMSSDGDESEEQLNGNLSSRTSATCTKYGSFAESSSRDELDDQQDQSNNALPAKSSELSVPPETGAKRRPIHVGGSNPSEQLHYRPLFFHTARSDEDEDSGIASDLDSSADSMDFATGIHSSSNVVQERQMGLMGRKHESGPIIFYNGAKFCTDLGGDSNGPAADKLLYRRCIERAVGCSPISSVAEESDENSEISALSHQRPASMDVVFDSPSLTRSAFDLEDLRTSISDCASDTDTPMSMEASGLGGVQPDDNFVVRVQTRRGTKRTSSGKYAPFSSLDISVRKAARSMPRTTADCLRETHDKPRIDGSQVSIRSEVISAVKTNMAPSSLPPPSYVCLPFSSSGSEGVSEGDHGDTGSCGRARFEAVDPKPASFLIASSADSENKESSYDIVSSGTDDSSSIDLLAHARVQDPEAIRAQEREFDSDRLSQIFAAQESRIPSGTLDRSASARLARRVESDVDSMGVDGDEESGMGDSD